MYLGQPAVGTTIKCQGKYIFSCRFAATFIIVIIIIIMDLFFPERRRPFVLADIIKNMKRSI